MSGAVRSRPRRSAARSVASLPYARPKQAPAKKSPWAIATGLLNYLNPLRLRSDSRSLSPIDVDDDDEPDSDSVSDESPRESLSARGRQMARNLPTPPQPPQPALAMEPVPYLLPDSSSPQKNLETVATFLEQRRGQTISPLEAEGLISLIHKSTPTEKTEPFRFSASASLPSTPARGNSPAHDLFTIGASSSTSALNGSSPRKTLSKNPNGVYRWSGGGSARPSKNRYASPAFGTPARAASEHLVFRDTPGQQQNDASPKRRRLETPAATPPPVPRSAAPGPSPTRAAASQYFPFPLSTPASSPVSGHSPTVTAPTPAAAATTPARAALALVKTVPAHPSPLRQAWGGSPGSSPSSAGSSPAQRTPTKTAMMVTSLLRDADAEVPRRTAEVRNPYQSASPVGTRVTNTHPPESGTRKRARAMGRPALLAAEKEKKEREEREKQEKEEKEKEAVVVPPQVIIEASLPKGSKRSRPPAHFNPSASLNSLSAPSVPATRRSPRLEPQRIEAVEEAQDKDTEEKEAGAPAAKRARVPAVNGNGKAVNGDTTSSEKEKEPAPAPTPAATQPFTFPASASTPSVFGNASSSMNGPTLGSSTSTSNASTAGTGFEFRPGPKTLASAPKEPSKLRYSFAPPPTPPPVADKEPERRMFPMDPPPPKAVPAPSAFASTSTSTFTPRRAQDPKEAARALPPTALPAFVFAVLTNASGPADKARDAARHLPKSALPTFDFTAPASVSSADKGKAKETAPVQGFNWAAAGVKPPKPASAPGSWECGTCMLANGPEAKDKCAVCDSPRAVPEKAPPVQGFNWAAAGAKPPKPANAPGSWTCGTCMLMNGPEVGDKCAVCDSPR
ncbi:hypothetical protein C8R44DRAFT_849716 [Mycena epipterygia]|nr:hypothetical protein C8R44DRAFT_849716 [Mycena epipterygia]